MKAREPTTKWTGDAMTEGIQRIDRRESSESDSHPIPRTGVSLGLRMCPCVLYCPGRRSHCFSPPVFILLPGVHPLSPHFFLHASIPLIGSVLYDLVRVGSLFASRKPGAVPTTSQRVLACRDGPSEKIPQVLSVSQFAVSRLGMSGHPQRSFVPFLPYSSSGSDSPQCSTSPSSERSTSSSSSSSPSPSLPSSSPESSSGVR